MAEGDEAAAEGLADVAGAENADVHGILPSQDSRR
jgi:hypothetical protein